MRDFAASLCQDFRGTVTASPRSRMPRFAGLVGCTLLYCAPRSDESTGGAPGGTGGAATASGGSSLASGGARPTAGGAPSPTGGTTATPSMSGASNAGTPGRGATTGGAATGGAATGGAAAGGSSGGSPASGGKGGNGNEAGAANDDRCSVAKLDPASPPQPLSLSGNLGTHDPTLIAAHGQYYLYSTGDQLGAKTSKDLRSWQAAPEVFTAGTRPSWLAERVPGVMNLWAPDIS